MSEVRAVSEKQRHAQTLERDLPVRVRRLS